MQFKCYFQARDKVILQSFTLSKSNVCMQISHKSFSEVSLMVPEYRICHILALLIYYSRLSIFEGDFVLCRKTHFRMDDLNSEKRH